MWFSWLIAGALGLLVLSWLSSVFGKQIALIGYRLGVAGGNRRSLLLVRAGVFLIGSDPSAWAAVVQRIVRLRAATTDGRTAEATALTIQLTREMAATKAYPAMILPMLYEALVSGGRYLDAVRLPRRWPARSRRYARDLEPAAYAIGEINRAEALHNIGRNREALELLARVEPIARRESSTQAGRLAIEGGRCLRAWVLAHVARVEEAEAELSRLDGSALAPRYAAEVEFTHALVALRRGQYDKARERTHAGLTAARRASSVRNAIFLLGAIAFDEGDDAQAIAEFERGAADAYRGQGGGALLACGLAFKRTGRRKEAKHWYKLTIERDPESQAACAARLLLQS